MEDDPAPSKTASLKSKLAKSIARLLEITPDLEELDRYHYNLKHLDRKPTKKEYDHHNTLLLPIQTKILQKRTNVKSQLSSIEKEHFKTYHELPDRRCSGYSELQDTLKYASKLLRQMNIKL